MAQILVGPSRPARADHSTLWIA